MELFKIPHNAKVNKVIPKNAFDAYTTSKQKKLFTDLILRITWLYKLSPDTVNLEAREIKEIQIFKVELKVKEEIQPILNIIDKSIPYNIIFIVEYEQEIYLSTSSKHPHLAKEDNAVIDWTFKSTWLSTEDNRYTLLLKKNLDAVYYDFCTQLSSKNKLAHQSLQELVQDMKQIDSREKEILLLKASISNCKQFNQKVNLNSKLKAVEKELIKLMTK